ncbi:MAG: hypothetical protein DLM70_10970 [Chloroflexi bacterium]|nr:MAG: hypothetical protein DLM70_10970 [Chloroflexota bacterium]
MCASPGYNSIQAAIDAAAPGSTIHVCAGSYAESLVVNKTLTLKGDSGATVVPSGGPVPLSRLPAVFTTDNLVDPDANLVVQGHGVKATVLTLTFAGPFTASNCSTEMYGILVIAGGSIVLTSDDVTNTEASDPNLFGCQQGVGIQVGRKYRPDNNGVYTVQNFVGTGPITSTQVTGYEKNGITVDGPGSRDTTSQSTITGAGQVNNNAQNGIQISRGATGGVTKSIVSANQYTGPGNAAATGILIFGGCGDQLDPEVSITGNTVSNNDVGIGMYNYDSTCSYATTTETDDTMRNNTVSNSSTSNTSGYEPPCDFATPPSCSIPAKGYEAGIADVGHGDEIIKNAIDGAIATFVDMPAYIVFPIDTTADTTVTLQGNTFHPSTPVSASAQKGHGPRAHGFGIHAYR